MRTIDASSAKAVARMGTPLSDASIVVTALSETASAAGTATGTENGTGNTVESAKETRSEKGRDGTAIEIATGNETASATVVSVVIGTDGTKRIAIGRAGKTARSAVGQCSSRKTAAVRVIVLPRLPMRHLGSEEGSVTKTYVSTSIW